MNTKKTLLAPLMLIALSACASDTELVEAVADSTADVEVDSTIGPEENADSSAPLANSLFCIEQDLERSEPARWGQTSSITQPNGASALQS